MADEPKAPSTAGPPAAGLPAGGSGAAGDPSMEDILASIRRILSEDETAAIPARTEPMVLALQESMIVTEPNPPARPEPPGIEPPAVEPPAIEAPSPPASAIEPPAAATPAPAAAPPAPPSDGSIAGMLRALIAEREALAVHRTGPTLEDLVRDEIRPLLQQWLDTNLPPLVERLVRAEVERVVGRALS